VLPLLATSIWLCFRCRREECYHGRQVECYIVVVIVLSYCGSNSVVVSSCRRVIVVIVVIVVIISPRDYGDRVVV
jgi:hypothetical protein